MSAVYFIGDTHWGHRNILKYRPEFSSVEEHDRVILDNIMSIADKRSHLWLLGDCFFDWYSLAFLDHIVKGFAAVKFVIGNHDTDSDDRQEIVREVISLCTKVHSLVKYKEFWLSHVPMHPCELRGRFNVHGHMHNQSVDDSRYLCVSCEHTGYKPITLDEVRERFTGAYEPEV